MACIMYCPVLDFRDFQDFFTHRPCPLVSFDPEPLAFGGIVRAIYHKSLADVPSMLTEMCG